MYLRRPIKTGIQIYKINNVLTFYNDLDNADSEEKRLEAFQNIVIRKALSDYLCEYPWHHKFPSYNDYRDAQLIRDSRILLLEKIHENRFLLTKYLNPKYFIKDIFYIPASIIEFLISRKFGVGSSIFFSILTWIATVLISAYAAEIKIFIDNFVFGLFE